MAVLRSQRQVSKTEFENTFSVLFRQTREYTLAVPRRRQRWLCTEINRHINETYRAVIEANEYFSVNKSHQIEHKNIKGGRNGELLQADKWQHLRWSCDAA